MFHIHVWNQSQSQSLNNSLNYTCLSRTVIFLFYLSLSCSDVTVYLKNYRMGSTVGLGDSNFSPTGLPTFSESFAFRFGVDYAQMKHCGPHPHSSSAYLLFWVKLFCTIAQLIAASFGEAFSSAFSILTKVGVGASFTLGVIDCDPIVTNKFVEAGTVFGHGVSSLVCGAVNVAAAVGMGCCSAIKGLP